MRHPRRLPHDLDVGLDDARELLEARAATDPKTAYRLYQKICDRVYDLAIGLWPVQPNDRVAVRSNVHGFQYNFLEGNTYFPLYNMYRS